MTTRTSATTIATWCIPIAKALESYGCDAPALFAQAGLDFSAIDDANVRFPVSGTRKLWKLAVEATGDPAFGLSVGRFVHPTNLHALGFSLLASSSLKDACLRLCRYQKVLSDAIRLEFSETDDAYSLTCDGRSGGELLVAEEAFEAMLAMLINLGRLFYQTDFKPLRVAIERPPPANIQPYLDFFAAPVRFSAGENRIDLGRAETEAVLPTGNAELASLNDQIVLEYLARFERNRVLERARRVLIQNLSSGEVSEEKVARELGMSLRNLQRRLQEEGSSYRRLLEDTRRELALKYIKQSHLSLGEITFLLGFSETSNFSRAFKRWTGWAPGAYRAGAQL